MIAPRVSFWKRQPELVLSLLLFALLMIHGSFLGLSDDEAYYWVLAQKPALAYAFHPPAVAWAIRLSQLLTGWCLGTHSAAVVRLPAALCSSFMLGMALRWLRRAGAPPERLWGAGWLLLSMAGLFALSWMMVPDLPLFAGWMLAFLATWRMRAGTCTRVHGPLLAFGVALAILSKYSGVLVPLSAFLSFIPGTERSSERGSGMRMRAWGWIFLGGIAGALPPLLWNASHEWASILYQIRDRHEGAQVSLVRYARFWLIEAFAVGPFLLAFAVGGLFRPKGLGETPAARDVARMAWIWALPPALIYCTQPLWSDFKPHWALIVWWPFALAMAWRWARGGCSPGFQRLVSAQRAYGLGLGALVLISCHVPLGNQLLHAFKGTDADPRLDVTNDLYGWRQLESFLRSEPGNQDLSQPVIGSRYQTAGQAYFSLGPGARVTLLPRDLKARDEWPELGVSTTTGPDWPRLTAPVYFVADSRYDAPPEFPGARCRRVGHLEDRRGPLVAKWIEVWRCVP